MLANLFNISPLLPIIEQNALILTPNNRLRNKILEAYGSHCILQGKTIWHSPRVYGLHDWLYETWQILLDGANKSCRGALVSDRQRELIWQHVIAATPQGQDVLNPEKLAQQADSAFKSLALWELPLSCLETYRNNDYHIFSTWAKAFQHELKQHQLVTPEAAYQVVADAFKGSILKKEATIYLKGFHDIPPLLQTVLTAAGETLEIGQEETKQPSGVSTMCRTEAVDFAQEVLSAARWSQKILHKDPQATIGIIIPNLGQCREHVERLFTLVFESHYLLPDTARYTLPFNFSAGIPLGTTPLVHDTLELLNLNRREQGLGRLCNLLQSPFFADAENEFTIRSVLIQRLKNLGKMTVSGADLRFQCQQIYSQLSDNPGSLSRRLQQVETLRRQSSTPSKQLPPGRWVELFLAQLDALGWPGQRRLDSMEYQQVSQWYQVLEAFASLATTGFQLDIDSALKELQKIAMSTHFQAQVPPSPIQILGALEGTGLHFSHCWVLGLQQHNWPPPPSPHPLLPPDLQRHHHMPHATSERELQFAQSLTDGYRHCASTIIFSSAQRDDETELLVSRLIEDLPCKPLDRLLKNTDNHLENYTSQLAQSQQLEWVDCAQGPTIDNSQLFKGGSAILQDQALCPFNAFAIHRLGAKAPLPPSLGLSAIEKGIVLHDALAVLWQQLKSQEALCELSDDALRTRVSECVVNALTVVQKQRRDFCGPQYCALEARRQTQLICQWLDSEKKRPPFQVIAVEQSSTIDIGNLHLQVRLDRLDQLESGERVLIDYKTGNAKVQSWQGPRPDQPQLPLYAVNQTDAVQAIAFALINAKQQQFTGLGKLSADIMGITPPGSNGNLDLPQQWDAVIQHWQSVLEALATEFTQGESRVAYRDRTVQRYYTDYEPLNRVAEQPVLAPLWDAQR